MTTVRRSPKLLEAEELFHVKLGSVMREHGVSVGEIASLLEVDRSVVQRWRAGQARPSAVYFGWLLQVLGVSPDLLVGPPPVGDYADALEAQAEALRARAESVRSRSVPPAEAAQPIPPSDRPGRGAKAS